MFVHYCCGARLKALETQNLNTHSAGSFLSTAAYRIQDHFLTNFPDGHAIAPVFVLSCVTSLQDDKPNKATSGIHGLLKHTK